MWWLRELVQKLSPAGLKHFVFAHRYSLAISGAMSVAGLLVFILINWVPGARTWPLLQLIDQVENRTLDMRFTLRGPRPVDPRVVIVAIDQNTFNSLGWPFPRFHHARVVDRLREDGARAIGFDIAFPSPDPNSPANFVKMLSDQLAARGDGADAATVERMREIAQKFDSDQEFAEALKRAGNVILGHPFLFDAREQASLDPKRVEEYNEILAYHAYAQIRKVGGDRFQYYVEHPDVPGTQYDGQGIVPNLRLFAEAAKSTGFFNFSADSDGTFRRAPLILRYPERVKTQLEENFYPSLAVQTLIEYLKAGPQDVIFFFNSNGPERLQIAQYAVWPDISGRVLINYAGRGKSYTHYSFSAVAQGLTPPGTFQDKIVLVGATALGIGDIRNTPFQKPDYPGVEIHANVIDNILHDNFLQRGFNEEMMDISIVLFCGAAMGLVFVTMRPQWSWLVFLGGAGGLFLFNYAQFRASHWLSLVIPALTLAANYVGVTSYRMIFEEREKRKVRGAFGMYVHPGLISQMMKNPDLLRLGGEEVEMSVLFSDVRGFTTISEKLTPTQLVHLLNEYLTAMSDVIMANWGTVDKYEGDAIMAFWGRPYPQPDHASRGCNACLAMLDRLNDLNRQWKAEGRMTLDIGVGLNTGRMVVGNMGSNKRFNYTVMGDSVNLGSRLEGQTKEYAVKIIISEFTHGEVADEFVCRELDLIRVKGKLKPVSIYELMARGSERQKYQPLVTVFAQGLAAYRNGRFDEALKIFREILAAYPDDGPSKLFLKRSQMYAENPPATWDGVFVATSK